MSLKTDLIVVRALRSDPVLLDMLPARDVYNTAIALPDAEAENAPVPYVIVTFDALDTADSTKDLSFGTLTDRVTVGVEITAPTRPELADIAVRIRQAVRNFFASGEATAQEQALIPFAYTMQAEPVRYDSAKPCYWQRLSFICDTDPD